VKKAVEERGIESQGTEDALAILAFALSISSPD